MGTTKKVIKVKSLYLKLIPFISIVVLFACNNQQKSSEDEKETSSNELAKDSTKNDLGIFSLKVLPLGMIHKEELYQDVEKIKWMGLFKNEEGFFLDNTIVDISSVYDPVSDEEGQKTGWNIKAAKKDSCIMLMERYPNLSPRRIAKLDLGGNKFLPGEKFTFNYLGVSYEFIAEGNIKGDGDYAEITNYKLFLIARSKGNEYKSLLIDEAFISDKFTEILFAGDLDGDNVLDLIIDTSNHYNAYTPTVFLSRNAGQGEVVKIMGSHTSLGC